MKKFNDIDGVGPGLCSQISLILRAISDDSWQATPFQVMAHGKLSLRGVSLPVRMQYCHERDQCRHDVTMCSTLRNLLQLPRTSVFAQVPEKSLTNDA